jgi:hypothetical protein
LWIVDEAERRGPFMNWIELNAVLKKLREEKAVLDLYEAEKAGAARKLWLRRIWSRYARLRRARERKEVVKI